MIVASIASHNIGVRRALALARQTADIIETEAGSGRERDKTITEALRLFAHEASALLLPEPGGEIESEEDDDG